MQVPRLFLAICAISFFWMIGTILIIQFPPLVKNVFTADKQVASLFLAIFSIGVAVGSVLVNRLLGGHVSARFAPASVIAMGLFLLLLAHAATRWVPAEEGQFYNLKEFMGHPGAPLAAVALLGISVTGGMFVVPLYAFLTTTVAADLTARTVAANNIVNSGAMVLGAGLAIGLAHLGVSVVAALASVSLLCVLAAALAWKLQQACLRCQAESA